MSGLTRIATPNNVPIFKGDPRMKEQDIDKWFQGTLRHLSQGKQRTRLYGADAGLCARRNVLLAHNEWVPSEVSSATNAYMRIGVALEEMLRDGLAENNRLIAWNPYLVDLPQIPIGGKIDLVIQDHEDELALVEVKSCGKLVTEPRVNHVIQAQTYAAVSGIHKVWLTYISRHVNPQGEAWGPNVSMRSFLVDTSRDALVARLQVAGLSVQAAKRKQLPPTPAHFRKHTECHYCEFRDLFCWKPRPGLGEDSPQDRMEELPTEVYMNLDRNAKTYAEELYNQSPMRKLRSISDYLLNTELPINLVELLRKERDKILKVVGKQEEVSIRVERLLRK